MSTLRLPLIGDFVYVSQLGNPDIERKYVVVKETNDGYHITPEDTKDVTSLIQYKFADKKWVVAGGENNFNVRLELNPELYDPINIHETDVDIHDLIHNGEFDQAKQMLDRYRGYGDLLVVSTQMNAEMEHDEPLYLFFLQRPNRVDIFNWLQRNYVVNYLRLLYSAILKTAFDQTEEVSSDIFEWLLDQDIDWSNLLKNVDHETLEIIDTEVISEDRIDIFEWIVKIPGLTETYKEHSASNQSILDRAEEVGAFKIIEYLHANPTKAARKR